MTCVQVAKYDARILDKGIEYRERRKRTEQKI